MPKSKPSPLPTKLSALIRVAVEDCIAYDRLVADNPDSFTWDMGAWLHSFYVRDAIQCQACMAGAVLYAKGFTCWTQLKDDAEPYFAIDHARCGRFMEALRLLRPLGGDEVRGDKVIQVAEIEREFERDLIASGWRGPARFMEFKDYLKYADRLESIGL